MNGLVEYYWIAPVCQRILILWCHIGDTFDIVSKSNAHGTL